MNEVFNEIFQQIFSKKNLSGIWEKRGSNEKFLDVNSEYPIRNIGNSSGGRTIEFLLSSNFGYFAKPLIYVNGDQMLFPKEFVEAPKLFHLGNFTHSPFRKEIDLLIGAFSLSSLTEAKKDQDVPEFAANGLQFEHLKAFDGTIQCYLKEESEFFEPRSIWKSELDDKPLAGFKLKENFPRVYPTTYSNSWYQKAASFRLLEILNPEV